MELNQCLQKLVSHFSNLMKDDDNGSDLLNEEFWVSSLHARCVRQINLADDRTSDISIRMNRVAPV